MVFSIDRMSRKISSLKRIELDKSRIDPGNSDIKITHTFRSSDRHSDVTTQDLSERWGISISTTVNTLKKITQKFLSSTVLLLSRRYITDRVFTRNTLFMEWSTDTMDTGCKSLEVNRYAQVFSNKVFFYCIYGFKKESGWCTQNILPRVWCARKTFLQF